MTHTVPTPQYLLALCPNEGNERFIPQMNGAEFVLYADADEAHALGVKALTSRTHRAFQIWTTGATFVVETKVVARP